jgi:hypothetical protein
MTMKTKDIFQSDLGLDNILDEMNLRAKQYHKGNSFSVERAQKQTAQDFQNYNRDGRYVPVTTILSDPSDGIYFIEKA